jgi:type IX secretion system PorP/SprF family membrane protein
MMRKNYIICLLLLMKLGVSNSQNVVEEFEMPSHNFIKYNKSIINPSLSVFNTRRSEVLLYHRNQWSELKDSPKTYFINYSGKNEEKSGYGLSIYQKNVGIWKSIGAIANYTRGVELSENSALAVGFNVIGFSSGLDTGKIIVGEADPLLDQYVKTNMVIINPGVSLKLNRLNIGVSAENIFDYNFSSKKSQTPFGNKTYSGHLMFTSEKSESDNLFENSYFSLITRGKYTTGKEIEYSGGAIYELPKAGWLQASYSNIFGVSAGAGFNITYNLSLGYNYEKTIKNTLTTIGATHEIYLSYSFDKNENKEVAVKNTEQEQERLKTLEQEEIQRFKKKVYEKEIVETDKITVDKMNDFVKKAEESKLNYLILPEKNTGVKKGYYLISSVYTENYKAVNKVNELKQKGLFKSGYFTTSSGQINYVFVERYEKLEDAKKAYSTKYNNKYKETMWILPIL